MLEKGVNIAILGATGAVGGEVLKTLTNKVDSWNRISLFGRRKMEGLNSDLFHQYIIDISQKNTYNNKLEGNYSAICTLGVGQPSKMSKEDFIKIDKEAVLSFAEACKSSGVRSFSLLSSVGANATSKSFYLKTKGELIEGLIAMDFERLRIFQPSMILTPKNRYGLLQGITLAIWPWINPLLFGSMQKYRGIKVDQLGKAIALDALKFDKGLRYFTWSDF